jgi:hypothetical protein
MDGLRRLGYDEDRLAGIADGAVQNPNRIIDLAIRNARVRIGYRERSNLMSPVEFVQLDAREQLDVVDQLACRVGEARRGAERLGASSPGRGLRANGPLVARQGRCCRYRLS